MTSPRCMFCKESFGCRDDLTTHYTAEHPDKARMFFGDYLDQPAPMPLTPEQQAQLEREGRNVAKLWFNAVAKSDPTVPVPLPPVGPPASAEEVERATRVILAACKVYEEYRVRIANRALMLGALILFYFIFLDIWKTISVAEIHNAADGLRLCGLLAVDAITFVLFVMLIAGMLKDKPTLYGFNRAVMYEVAKAEGMLEPAPFTPKETHLFTPKETAAKIMDGFDCEKLLQRLAEMRGPPMSEDEERAYQAEVKRQLADFDPHRCCGGCD